MIPPKYKFSTFKPITGFIFKKESTYDPATGIINKTVLNAILSELVPCTYTRIYSAYDVDFSEHESAPGARNEDITIFQFDKDKNFIAELHLKKRGLYTLHKDVSYIRIELTSLYPELTQSYDRMVSSRTSFDYLYGYIRDIKPVYSKLSMKYKKESNQEFLRKSLEGKINLFGQDYEFLKNSSINDSYLFLIERWDNHKYEGYYTGLFNKATCKLDYEKCKCELKLTTLDQYTELLSKYDNTYDLIQLGVYQTNIDLCKRPIVQAYIRGGKTITAFMANTYYEQEVSEVIDDHKLLTETYLFNRVAEVIEIRIQGATDKKANGVYAGTLSEYKIIPGTIGDPAGMLHTSSGKASNSNAYVINIYREYRSAVGNSGSPDANYNLTLLDPEGTELYSGYFLEEELLSNKGNLELKNSANLDSKCQIDYCFKHDIYARLLCDVDKINNAQTYDLPSDDFVANNTTYKKVIGLNRTFVTVIASSITSKSPTHFGKNDYDEYFTNNLYLGLTNQDLRIMPLCRYSWVNASIWYALDYSIFTENNSKKFTLEDGWALSAVLMTLLAEIDPGIKHRAISEYSDFLYNGNGEINVKRFEVFLTQKTNILKGDYDQAAQKAEISFKDIMDMLRDCFRCYMFIEDGKLKIEHISYFYDKNTENNTYDITHKRDMFNKQRPQYFQSEIEYDVSDLYPRYEFSFADDATFAFNNLTIDINAVYTKEASKNSISISKFSSDIDMMLYAPSEFGEDGFALMCCEKIADKYIVPIVALKMQENNREYEIELQNGYAAFLNLVSFYMYDMPAYSAKSNAAVLEVKGLKHFMKHSIQFPVKSTLETYSYINTSFGPGKIDSLDIDMNTLQYKIGLLYNPG